MVFIKVAKAADGWYYEKGGRGYYEKAARVTGFPSAKAALAHANS